MCGQSVYVSPHPLSSDETAHCCCCCWRDWRDWRDWCRPVRLQTGSLQVHSSPSAAQRQALPRRSVCMCGQSVYVSPHPLSSDETAHCCCCCWRDWRDWRDWCRPVRLQTGSLQVHSSPSAAQRQALPRRSVKFSSCQAQVDVIAMLLPSVYLCNE